MFCRRCEGRLVPDSVFQHGRLTSRSAGCGVFPRKQYRESDIIQTWGPPPKAAGRAAAARIKRGAQYVVYGPAYILYHQRFGVTKREDLSRTAAPSAVVEGVSPNCSTSYFSYFLCRC